MSNRYNYKAIITTGRVFETRRQRKKKLKTLEFDKCLLRMQVMEFRNSLLQLHEIWALKPSPTSARP